MKKYQGNDGNPKDIEFYTDISDDSSSWVNSETTFIVFKSINDILYLIYQTKNQSIVCYDLKNQKKINEIKNEYITNLIHYYDDINKRDLVMSISVIKNDIKVWNANNWEYLLNIKNNRNFFTRYLACFCKEKEEIYIITCSYHINENPETIKVYNFNGRKIKEINNSCEDTFFIDVYFDKILLKNYIIAGNFGCVKSYDYNKNELYYKYDDHKFYNNEPFHCSIIVNNNKEIVKLIESGGDEYIRIWNFHSKSLLNKIKVGQYLYSICEWNDNYLFIGCKDNTIKLIDINKGVIDKSLVGHHRWVLLVKKIYHHTYGECLLSQEWGSKLKLWIIKK